MRLAKCCFTSQTKNKKPKISSFTVSERYIYIEALNSSIKHGPFMNNELSKTLFILTINVVRQKMADYYTSNPMNEKQIIKYSNDV